MRDPGLYLAHLDVQHEGAVIELLAGLLVFEVVDLVLVGGGAAEGADATHLVPLADAGVAVLVVAAGHHHGLVQGLQADDAVHYLYLSYYELIFILLLDVTDVLLVRALIPNVSKLLSRVLCPD